MSIVFDYILIQIEILYILVFNIDSFEDILLLHIIVHLASMP